MSTAQRILRIVADTIVRALSTRTSRPADARPGRPGAPAGRARLRDGSRPTDAGVEPGRGRDALTVRLDPARLPELRIEYAPDRDGAPDAGEVIWTWVPYEEGDGRGKDRPVLVIGTQSQTRVYAVRMTSKAHERDRDYLPIGSGAWDSQGRESWVDVEQLYSVHVDGMRREAAILDRRRYDAVAAALTARYGWR